MGRVRFGIAGWSYADWKGRVYPLGCRDPLAWCARFVDLLEVNATFYRTPTPETVAGWVTRTAALGTIFTVKLGQSFTHERRLDRHAVAAFAAALQPLVVSGRLRALLAQFSFAFVADAGARAHLADLVAAFAALAPIAVEVRHASWQRPEALAWLRELGVSLVDLDYPGGRDGMAPLAHGIQGAGFAYFRLHGRNARAWFDRNAGRDEVYDWLYRAEEVGELGTRLRGIAAGAAETLVVANNHFEGKALKVALELRAAHTDAPVDVPEPLLATYPELGAIARRSGQGSLFGPRSG